MRSAQIYSGRRNAEVADEIEMQIEHLGPEERYLFVTLSFFSGHVGAGDQTLFTRVFPMRLASDAAHQSIRIKCQIAYRVYSLLLGFEVFGNRRTVGTGQRRIADKVQIRFGATGNDRQARSHAIATFCLDIAQHRLAFEAVEAFTHQHRHSVFAKIIGQPRAEIWIDVAV